MPSKRGLQPNEKLLKAAEAYRGRWIAIYEDTIVLAGDDPLTVEREAEARGIDYDIIEYVARPEELGPLVV